MELLVIIGILILILRFVRWVNRPITESIKRKKEAATLRKCPFCKSDIPKDASVCKYCQREVGVFKPETSTTGDLIDSKAKRWEIVNSVLTTFKEQYPKAKLKFDNMLIEIKTPWFSKLNKREIQGSLIKALKDRGVDAKPWPVAFSDSMISVVGFMDSVLENWAEEVVSKGEISPDFVIKE